MRKQVLMALTLFGALAIWIKFLKNDSSKEQIEGTVVGKRESRADLNGKTGQIRYLVEIETESHDLHEIEVDKEMFTELAVGDWVNQDPDGLLAKAT